MIRMKHDSRSVLLRFRDSKSVHRLDALDGAMQIVATKDGVAGGLHIPELAGEFATSWSGNHQSLGYVYVLAPPWSNDWPLPPAVVLVDGAIESSFIMDSATKAALGMGDGRQFEDR